MKPRQTRRDVIKKGGAFWSLGVLSGQTGRTETNVNQDLRRIQYGQTKTGQIDEGDPKYSYSDTVRPHAEPITFEARAGDSVFLKVKSSELGGMFYAIETHDRMLWYKFHYDFSWLVNSFWYHDTLPRKGEYTAWIGPYPGDSTGKYTVSLEKVGEGHVLRQNEAFEEQLSKTDVKPGGYDEESGGSIPVPSYADSYLVPGKPDKQLRVSVRSSDFTPKIIYAPRSQQGADYTATTGREDTAESTATFTHQFSERDTLWVAVTALEDDATGSYTLERQVVPDRASVHVLLPTYVNESEDGPAKRRADAYYDAEKPWVIKPVGKHWASKPNKSRPRWLPDDVEITYNKHYVRLPAYLSVSSSFADSDTVVFENLDLGFDSSYPGVLGIEDESLPDRLTPGWHTFHILMELAQAGPQKSKGEPPAHTNPIGSLTVGVEVPTGSPLTDIAQEHGESGLSVTSEPYGASYGQMRALSDAYWNGMKEVAKFLALQSISLLGGPFSNPSASKYVLKLAGKAGKHIVGELFYAVRPDKVTVEQQKIQAVSGTSFVKATRKGGWFSDGKPIGLSGPSLTLTAGTQK